MLGLIKDRRALIRFDTKNNEPFNYKGIRIYPHNSLWYISLSDGLCFADQSKVCRLEKKKYIVRTDERYYELEIYVYENDEGLDEYGFYENRNFIIAASAKADVICKDPFLKEHYLYLKDGILGTNFNISVNGRKYDGFPLPQGALVEYLGFRFIYYEDFLYINRFACEIRLKEYHPDERKFRYAAQNVVVRNLISEEMKELELAQLKKFEPLRDERNKGLLKTILPNSIMSMTMLGSAVITYWTNLSYGRSSISALTYLLSPFAMILCGVFLPLIFHLADNRRFRKNNERHINEYLEYLSEYESDLEQRIDEFTESFESHCFNPLKLKEEPFYLHPNDPDFMCISLGHHTISLDFPYEESEKQIDTVLERIRHRLSFIENIPLLIDLKENRVVTIISRASDRLYFFRRFLLELAYKHHYDDLMLAVYTREDQVIDSFYNLPHLFDNGRRFTLNSVRQLQELDQRKLEKPLVLLMLEKSEHVFTNPNIFVIFFTAERAEIRKESSCFIEYLSSKALMYKDGPKEFNYVEEDPDFRRCFFRLGRYGQLNEKKKTLDFRDLYQDFDIVASYKARHFHLKADFAMSEGEILGFDLHESAQGPHGLIGGSTGSGKSELIISMLLSLCIRYSPEYLNIVLIDYKGGGIRESLSSNGAVMPHIIASVSNLENNSFERLIIALNNECKRRQLLFHRLSEKTGISIMDLDDYLNSDPESHDQKLLAHLLIVVDEFAELKKQNPEEIRELISVSRIGRSLGIHLILATQKPSGNIDDEIWSNSRFKIALKVFEEKDSVDILRNKEAAYLKRPGMFMLKVDENIIRAQSFYAKSDISGHDPYETAVLDNTLNVLKKNTEQRQTVTTQAAYFTARILEITHELKIEAEKLDFLSPEPLNRKDNVRKGFILFGQIDDYIRNRKKKLEYAIDQNILISSSRRNEMNMVLNTLKENGRQCILIASRSYENEVISDTLRYEDEEDIIYLFRLLLKQDHEVTLLIEDLSCLLSYNDSYSEYIYKLLRRSEKAVYSVIALTTGIQLNFKLINAFRNRLMIRISEMSDLNFFFTARCAYKGDSFCYDEEPVCFIPVDIEGFESEERRIQGLIKRIPDPVLPKADNERCLLGFDPENREEVYTCEKIPVISFDDELLERYRKAYGDRLEFCIYDHALNDRSKKKLLWLGPGIFAQRLFMCEYKDDLNDDEAVYVCRSRKILLRSLGDVQDPDETEDGQKRQDNRSMAR
ncbi:MAG: hypothetical protein IJF87_12245 [Erysipelotrichaceae bacterium]|nr:hypothetical protein [Erysipelotrichaceae bacterium]MBQ6492726.1 hypothetical protein [Erysipelotrichaceae bacterium]